MFLQVLMTFVIAGYVGACEARAPFPWKDCDSRWGLVVGWMIESPVTSFANAKARKKRLIFNKGDDDIQDSPS